MEITIDDNSLSLKENGREIFLSNQKELNFTQAYLYLQMSSHSNYPSREVYFDDILVRNAE